MIRAGEGHMAEAKKLGELLIDAGLIDTFQLESALAHQRNWGGKLGGILVELEFAREEDVAKVIAEKLRLPYAQLFDPEVPEAVLKLIKPDIAKKYIVMPVKKEGGGLVVAMSDPLDIDVIDELRFITSLNIKPALALESEIKLAIRKYYDREQVVRRSAASFKEITRSSSGKMEIIRGSDLNMPKVPEVDPSTALLSREETTVQSVQDGKIRLDALISLLIEKGIISREELVSMIYQKKLGL
jgi:type IV pilus assembly protein PilB